ncbi:hypothetical protein VDF76_03585 [Xanthomonas campestris pv. raphani]|uniref:hypothetical protein n=1 Tax=Xanthomonas campestris TaxID=339 RepID=UPI002B23E8C0|nr:hypothetical protein [Xanthomonas campestris]MEA9746127.1 hypothetical protein [Xanthomonas campestris pv. raphani]
MDIWNKRVGLMSILLTLFRSNVCWAKPNHAFFTVNTLLQIFFSLVSPCVGKRRRKPALPAIANPAFAQTLAQWFFKKHFFCAVFFMHAVQAHTQALRASNTTRCLR